MNTPEKIAEQEWIETSRGVESINFQRSAQMTWWSIVMGLAIVVLAEKISAILDQISTQGHWYLFLYVISSGLIVILAWVKNAWGILIYSYPIRLLQTGITLIVGITIYLTCLAVDNPANWCLACGFVGIATILQMTTNLRTQALMDLPTKSTYQAVAVTGVVACGAFIASWHLTTYPSAPVAWLWGVIAAALLAANMWMQSRDMAEERRLRNIS
jgi:hypothetical protein